MRRYEVIKEIINPCGGNRLSSSCEITEQRLDAPGAYIQAIYGQEKGVDIRKSTQPGGTVIEVVFNGGQKHRYTFNEM